MSPLLRNLRRNADDRDGGFTLVEMMVALTVVAIAAAGTVPLLVVGMRAAAASKLHTQAKNLAQQRLESMRDLQFHVDRQNGPFVDLLDVYYTNLSASPSTRTRANEVQVGNWVSGGAAAPAPAGAFYQVRVASLPGSSNFSQIIDTQFLDATGRALPATTFAGYDSQIGGRDQPATLMVGVTVITSWTYLGVGHSYTTYTRIADVRGQVSSLTTQGIGEYLRVSSTGPAGNALTVDVATAEANGSQSTGSVAGADVRALQAKDQAGTDYLGATGVASSPSGGGALSSPVAGFSAAGGGACGWLGVGPTQVSDVTATTDNGLPQVPSDVDSSSPPTHQVAAGVTSAGNGACGIFGFSNQSNGYDPRLLLAADTPLVRVNNDPANNVVISGSAWVNATSPTAVPHGVSSGASARSTKRLQLFPGAGFVPDGGGVVDILLNQATIACASSVSGGVATQSATGSWSVTIDYWQATDSSGHGQRVTLPTYNWNSSSGNGSADPLAALNPASIVVYQNGTTTLYLSDYIASWGTARSVVENSASGVHQLSGVVALSTRPVRQNDTLSAVGVQLGNLSCVADDGR